MTPRDLACRDFVELITDYLEGVLPAADVAAVEHHLSICEACARYVAQLRAVLDLLGSIPVDPLPDEAYDTLLETFRGRTPTA